MNRCRLLLVALAMIMALPCFAKKRKVELRDEKWKEHRSPFEKLPVEAWVEDDNKDLLLEFSENLGTVQVTVANTAGQIVYSQMVDTGESSSFIVDLDGIQNEDAVLSVSTDHSIMFGKL